jgi:hypothetical protein
MPHQDATEIGYELVYDSEKIHIWVDRGKNRLYVDLLYPITEKDMDDAVGHAQALNLPAVDLITDHSHMPPLNQVQGEDLYVCLDRFFDRLQIRNVVRICTTEETCGVCIPLDTRLSAKDKGRLQGRVGNLKSAADLLDNQVGGL